MAALAILVAAGCSADGSDEKAGVGSSTSAVSSTTTVTSSTTADAGSTASRQEYVEAVAEAMRSVEDTNFPIDDEQAGCLAPKWVDAIGYETLVDAGVTPEVLGGGEDGDTTAEFQDVVDRARAEKLVDAFGACGIDLEDFFYESLASDGTATPEQIRCLQDRLPSGFVRDMMVTSMDRGDEALDSDPELEDQFTEAFVLCIGDG